MKFKGESVWLWYQYKMYVVYLSTIVLFAIRYLPLLLKATFDFERWYNKTEDSNWREQEERNYKELIGGDIETWNLFARLRVEQVWNMV